MLGLFASALRFLCSADGLLLPVMVMVIESLGSFARHERRRFVIAAARFAEHPDDADAQKVQA